MRFTDGEVYGEEADYAIKTNTTNKEGKYFR